MPINLKGKVALITGGSAGLGKEIARQLASKGVNIAINYNSSESRAQEVAKSLIDTFGVKADIIKGDAFQRDFGEKMINSTLEKFGSLDIVISNAGWTKIVPFENLEEIDDDLWDGCLQVNVKTHFYLYKAAKKVFDKNIDGGTFIVSASVAGRIVYGSSIPYAVSKAALIHLVKMLAKTQGPNTRVHAVCPGLLMTEWGKKFSDEKIEHTKKLSPLQKLADVEETALQFVVLCQLATSTGSIVGIDGGISI